MKTHGSVISLGLGLMLCLVGFPQICETIYTPSLPSVAQSLNATAQATESTLAIYFVGFAIGVLLWGTCSDLIGRRRSMLIGLIIFIISCFACSASHSVEALLFWRFVQALGASVGSVITQTMLRDVYDTKKRSQIFSLISAGMAFSPALGPFIGGFVSERMGWRANFWILILMGIALFMASLLNLPETKPKGLRPPSGHLVVRLMKKMLISKPLWGHILLISSTNGILFSFYEEAPFIFIDQLGMRPSHYGLLGIIIASATILSARMNIQLCGKLKLEKLINVGSCLILLGGALLIMLHLIGLFHLTPLGITSTFTAFFITFLGIGFIIPNSLSVALKDYQDLVGSAGSLFGGAYYSLIALFTWAMGLIHNGTTLPLPLYFTTLGALSFLGALLIKTPQSETV